MFFSQATRGFYPADMRAQYEAAGTWPADAVLVDAESEAALREALADGASVSNSGDTWTITPAPPRPFAEIAAPRMASFRQNREIALNRLSGLGFAALLAGDAEHAEEIASVRASLLDVPTLPQVQASATLDDLDTALNAAWQSAYAGGESDAVAIAMAVGAGGGQTRPT